MQPARAHYLAALGLGLAGALHASPATAQTPPCGTVVTQSIRLTSNMVCPNHIPALIIGADNVYIELNGFDIFSPVPPNILQPWLSNYEAAISARGYDGVQVFGPGRIANYLYGIRIIGGRGHVVAHTSGGSYVGIFLGGASDSVVESNEIASSISITDHDGLPSFNRVGPALGNKAVNNQVGTAAYRSGVIALHGCLVAKNTVSGNTIQGVLHLHDGTHLNTIERNRIHSSTSAASVAVQVAEAHSNDIVGNLIDADGEVGISIEPRSSPTCSTGGQPGMNGDDNFVHGNIVQNGSIGLRLGAMPPAPWTLGTGNVILGNTFMDMTVAGQRFGTGTAKNDGRLNKYANVPVEVEDFGTANLWP